MGYKYAVIFAKYNGKWIFCKHKKRSMWETTGGHIEKGKFSIGAAKRELFEETGATNFDVVPLCDFWVCDEPHETIDVGWSNGTAFIANVKEI